MLRGAVTVEGRAGVASRFVALFLPVSEAVFSVTIAELFWFPDSFLPLLPAELVLTKRCSCGS